ncbi:hypothetical protein [Haloferax sp. Atlit-12N]|uniref:hypothetical protein n=1 Tax=Haloferax sp. Atlit-12N TaxID=2077203 RepID=UPI0011E5A25C|nr:hypothetical protein [Haloferax sp. Atlit-12N]
MTKKFSYREFRSKGGLLQDTEKDDLFIVSAGFEPRATAVVDALSTGYRAKVGIVYVNEELLSDYGVESTKDNLKSLKNELEDYCDEVRVAKGSWLNSGKQLQAFENEMADLGFESDNSLRVSIDSTCFSKETLLILLNLLYYRFEPQDPNVFYVSPKSHGEWLSRGHRNIRNILGQAGIHQSTRPTTLVLLSGFESNRAEKIIEEFEASEVMLGIGDPPTNPDFLDRNENEQDMILAQPEVDTFQFPAASIDGTREIVSDIIQDRISKRNVVVAPQSTKLSTIGAWEASRSLFEVQMSYSVPGEYNYDSYSEGIDSLYIDTISM